MLTPMTMSDISKYTGRFRVSAGFHETTSSKGTRRPRQSHTCNQCRISKLRCDKARPCSSCVKRDTGASCSYQKQFANEENGRSIAEDRLDRLENMVTQLMHNQNMPTFVKLQATSSFEASSDPNRVAYVAQGTADDNEIYPTVLEDIMNNINELKHALPSLSGELERMPVAEYNMRGCERIFGSPSAYSVPQILAQHLPNVQKADQLLATFFSGDTFMLPYIHARQFRQQYKDFQSDNTVATPMWLSLLFSIFTMASMAQEAVNMSSAQTEKPTLSPKYHIAAGECLVLGQYHKAQLHAPQALLLYAHCVSLKTLDPSRDVGAIISMAVRIAYEMGYHRDPDVFGTFSVFDGEMRRRFWAGCKQIDMMASFQLGLPSNIRLENCDTRSPRNLLDSDFGPESESLPPSRPETEPTGLLWFIVKDRLLPSFSKVCQDALSLLPKSEAHVRALDDEVRLARSTVPEVLRVRALAECTTESKFLIMSRFYIELLSQKSLCILHRRQMTQGSRYSTGKCVEAGLAIVRMTTEAYRAFAPGGFLHDVRWMFNCYYMSDFLLGVIVLCLYINLRRQSGASDDLPALSSDNEIYSLLEQSLAVCEDKSSASRDARKVSLAIHLVLQRAGRANDPEPSRSQSQPYGSEIPHSSQPWTEQSWMQEEMNWNNPTLIHGELLSFEELDPFNFMSTGPFSLNGASIGDQASNWD